MRRLPLLFALGLASCQPRRQPLTATGRLGIAPILPTLDCV
ncbi:MAG: hypothetical protein SFW67_30800 [Myxococcaceae bacterium]|nr:hypothetical protein [Myxococcaceae bacterium]